MENLTKLFAFVALILAAANSAAGELTFEHTVRSRLCSNGKTLGFIIMTRVETGKPDQSFVWGYCDFETLKGWENEGPVGRPFEKKMSSSNFRIYQNCYSHGQDTSWVKECIGELETKCNITRVSPQQAVPASIDIKKCFEQKQSNGQSAQTAT